MEIGQSSRPVRDLVEQQSEAKPCEAQPQAESESEYDRERENASVPDLFWNFRVQVGVRNFSGSSGSSGEFSGQCSSGNFLTFRDASDAFLLRSHRNFPDFS
jgi:hypothetical protein